MQAVKIPDSTFISHGCIQKFESVWTFIFSWKLYNTQQQTYFYYWIEIDVSYIICSWVSSLGNGNTADKLYKA